MVRPTQPRLQAVGLRPWTVQPKYQAYHSPFAPVYAERVNLYGLNAKQLGRYAVHFAGFGATAMLALLYFASSIPRVQRDIFKKVPLVSDYYDHEIPASDNPF